MSLIYDRLIVAEHVSDQVQNKKVASSHRAEKWRGVYVGFQDLFWVYFLVEQNVTANSSSWGACLNQQSEIIYPFTPNASHKSCIIFSVSSLNRRGFRFATQSLSHSFDLASAHIHSPSSSTCSANQRLRVIQGASVTQRQGLLKRRRCANTRRRLHEAFHRDQGHRLHR